ncbi:DUF6671 family protein [Pedobacter glucosidilyticus]|uniref:DUF6671 family protein n=1 Tax=Pedobacter glucosidilyticus TaxID=1122941 RepID=UPI00040B9A9F|nr:DUF6671 family protein [Pedobacter glucosidilyticus]
MFNGRKLIIATKHKKEMVIAPVLEKELGVKCFIDENFDTDTLGTFTGEVERCLDPIETAREKCLRAMKLNNCDLGLASEGSFGPHPSLFFVNADDEFLIFIDQKMGIEIIARELSTVTNFNGKHISDEKELLAFASEIGFPQHALILRPSKDTFEDIHKGIVDTETLIATFHHLYKHYQSVYAETDMRALYNPTRMGIIEKATYKLLRKIQSLCPKCQMPGFDVTDAKPGLKCSLCGLPTKSTLSYVYTCKHCEFSKEELYPHQKTTEDPTYCDYCNP